MYYDFRAKKFVMDERKDPSRNLAELEAMLAGLQAKPSFTLTDQHIAGTRTSNTVFTRSSGTWTADALKGKLIAAFVNTATSVYSLHKVASNTTTAITIETMYGDASLVASADRIVIADTMQELMDACSIVAVP